MRGPGLAAMAWRNLWRNRRRTLITLSSIAFGSTLAVIFTGAQDANFGAMIDLAARMGGGHVTLQNPEYLDAPTLSRTVEGVERLRRVALRDDDVERVATRITGQLMLSTASQSYGAGFIAVDPAAEDVTTLSVLEAIVEGDMFDSSRSNGIILGERLAENLDTGLGRKVVYTLTDKHGEIVRDLARVTGILRTGATSVDAALCILPIDRLREVLDYAPDEGIQLALFLRDQRRADRVAARLDPEVGSQVAALTWKQVQPDLAGFIAMKVVSAQLLEGLIMLLIAAGIFNTLFVSVMERSREFGIMLAIGFGPGSLFRQVMYESLWLGLCGLAAGALLAAWPYHYLNTTGFDLSGLMKEGSAEVAGVIMRPQFRVEIFPEHLVAIIVLVLLATLLSGVYPAWRASRLEPVESIRLV